MDAFRQMQAFTAVVQAGSFVKAAQRLDCRFDILDARQAFLAAVQHIHSHWSA